MKVFISWSGERSRQVGELFRWWIKCVLQATQPWYSPQDIERGVVWYDTIGKQLNQTDTGIICLTRENLSAPWILFEAGALAKGLDQRRVCTFLIDLKPGDVKGPLAQFNHTLPDKESIRQLIVSLNFKLGGSGIDNDTLARSFDAHFAAFAKAFETILKEVPDTTPAPPPRDTNDLLTDVLREVQRLSVRMGNLEEQSIPPYIPQEVVGTTSETITNSPTTHRTRELAEQLLHLQRKQDRALAVRSQQVAELMREHENRFKAQLRNPEAKD